MDAFPNVSFGNQTVTSSLTTADCTLAVNMQTDVGTPNINVMLTRTITIRAPSLTMRRDHSGQAHDVVHTLSLAI